MLIEHGSARVQASPQRRLIRPALAEEGLQRHGLVRALNLGMVGWTALADEADLDAQGQEQADAGGSETATARCYRKRLFRDRR